MEYPFTVFLASLFSVSDSILCLCWLYSVYVVVYPVLHGMFRTFALPAFRFAHALRIRIRLSPLQNMYSSVVSKFLRFYFFRLVPLVSPVEKNHLTSYVNSLCFVINFVLLTLSILVGLRMHFKCQVNFSNHSLDGMWQND